MNIFDFEDEYNDSLSDRSVAPSHLDPSAVLQLAESLGVPLLKPPVAGTAGSGSYGGGTESYVGTSGSYAALGSGSYTSSSQAHLYSRQSSSPSRSTKSQLSSLSLLPSTSTIDSFKKKLKQQFTTEKREDGDGGDVLSFLVGADGSSPVDGSGGGIARIDVYCKSGTVCINRVICTQHTTCENSASLDPSIVTSESIKASYSISPSTVWSSLLAAPRTKNAHTYSSEGVSSSQSFSPTSLESKSPTVSASKSLSPTSRSGLPGSQGINVQVRRIFRRKVNMEGLRKLMVDPPRLIEIGEDIVKRDGETEQDSGGSPNKGDGGTGEGTKIQLSGLSEAQRQFLRRERKNYNRRLRHEEKIRMQMAHLVLSEGSIMDLPPITNVDSKDTVGSESSLDSGMPGQSTADGCDEMPESGKIDTQTLLQENQTRIRSQIHLADIGIAILTGEIESIERMMTLLKKEQNNLSDADSLTNKSSAKERKHPREGKKNEKQSRGREGAVTSRLLSLAGTSSSRSLSRSIATSRRSSFSTIEQDSESDSSASLDDSEAEEIARMLQGCEVEYSFLHAFHDELEDALLAHELSTDDESMYSSGGEEYGARRGRTRHRGGEGPRRTREIPTIVAVPTNGQGCIVLRNNGAFSVIGTLPKPLYKQLFSRGCPFPEYIALGTRGRFYVRFEDGSFKFNGPSSLKRFLDETGSHDSVMAKSRFFLKGVKSRKKIKIDNRLQHSISSIAFGKRFDDVFLVRNDGSWESHGDMPKGLVKLLHDRRDRGDLAWVALGPNNEWCLKAKNERIWWGGVSEEVDDHLSRILMEDEENGKLTDLKFIDFGVEDSFFLLHQ